MAVVLRLPLLLLLFPTWILLAVGFGVTGRGREGNGCCGTGNVYVYVFGKRQVDES